MIGFKILIHLTILVEFSLCNDYGLRMRTEALARSKLDDRITAILNTGREFIDFDKFDTNEGNSKTNSTIKTEKIDKYGETSSEQVKELPIIEVNGSDMPVSIVFRTNSPQINVQQKHEHAIPTKVESTRTEEEPHRLIHEVYRPVIQELWEVIQPYRKYVQQIQPVIEEVQQIISSSQNPRRQSSNSQNNAIKSQMSGSGLYGHGSAQYQKRSGLQIPDKYIEEQIIASPVPQLIQSIARPQKSLSSVASPALLINDVNELKGQSSNIMSISSAQNLKSPLKDQYFRLGGALEGLNSEGPKRRGSQIYRNDEMALSSAQPNSEYYFKYNDYPLDYNLVNNQRTRLYEDFSSGVYDLDHSSGQPLFDDRLSRRSVIKLIPNDFNLMLASFQTKSKANSFTNN